MRISDWSSDVCSSDLRGLYRSGQPAVSGATCEQSGRAWRFVWISGRGSRRRVLVMAIAPVGQMQTAQPFTWGQGGQRLTPEDIALQRRLAAQQMQQGADFSPIGHWSQGLAREIGRASCRERVCQYV